MLYSMLFISCLILQLAIGCNGRHCRTLPGDADFPSLTEWDKLNDDVGGRLLAVVPSAKTCQENNCTKDQWLSAGYRASLPGAMVYNNWEQDYATQPPSLCLLNGTTCEQGNVPVFAINASSAEDIQAGVLFAAKYNLKIAVKASGHDFLGRSTAKGSLLLWTHNLQSINFTDSFVVHGKDMGSAVTVGSGVPLNMLYSASKAVGKMFVGGTAANVVAAGGYVQGGGHSAFSPIFGLAADNVLEFQVVLANGDLVFVNEFSHSDREREIFPVEYRIPHADMVEPTCIVFWALRGGGAGSWGVVISATFRTYPTFEATLHQLIIYAPSSEAAGRLAAIHAAHIFDWDEFRSGQYFFILPGRQYDLEGYGLAVVTYFANGTAEQASAAMKPFIDDVKASKYYIVLEKTRTTIANDLVYHSDDVAVSSNEVLGSRLMPISAYRRGISGIAATYKYLLDEGVDVIAGHLVAGGMVAENANISNAVHPKWRTAKSHMVVAKLWGDADNVSDIELIKSKMTSRWVPALQSLTGEAEGAAYSNEADRREPDFQNVFYGTNYQRLIGVKRKYDPQSLFIVAAGVGSEEWDESGICEKREGEYSSMVWEHFVNPLRTTT